MFKRMSSLRMLHALSRVCSFCSQGHISCLRQSHSISNKLFTWSRLSTSIVKTKPCVLAIPMRNLSSSSSEDPSFDMSEYPAEVEVSYEDFKFVEQLLPASTVPEVPHHSSYPTPSGWIPPNDEIRSQQPYRVCRTKNHVLPIYANQKEVWGRMMHHDTIRNIEGDIWKLESELRHHLKEMTGKTDLITQVHEVSRCIRIRGQHRDSIAKFLLDKGM